MARKYHPDLNPNDKNAEAKFKEINEANEVLSHPENRKKYDTYGVHWKKADAYEQAQQQQRSGSSQQRSYAGQQSYGGQQSYAGEDYSDFFESMSSGGQRQRTAYRGQDFNAELHLNLMDVYTTHQRTLTVNGKNIRITIPAGVTNGPKGDLFITFVINNDTRFKREAADLFLTQDIPLLTAILGGSQLIETLDGTVKLTLKEGTQNGTKVKLKGKGFPKYKQDNEYGDLYITYNVVLPKTLTPQQKELYLQLSKLDA